MFRYREIKILATAFAARVRDRYRPATPDEEQYALDDREAVVRANTLPFDRELDDAAITLACLLLEPVEGVASRWVPRADTLSLDANAEDDIETLAGIIAHAATTGYEPVPYAIATEFEIASGISSNSRELVADSINSAEFTTTALYELVFDRACTLLDRWNGEAGLWWTVEEPELPFDRELDAANPPLTIISTEKDAPF
jgi:hypothetical protein